MIEVKNAFFSYDYSETTSSEDSFVLKGVDFTANDGEFVAVIGPNGSGKSTLAKLLNGMELPIKGGVFVDGIDSRDDEHIFDVRRNVGMVLQNPDNQIISTIVEEDVAFGPENLGIPPEEIRRRVDWALETVGMSEFKLHEPHKLSGGQKQRIAIAGILAMQPKYIVLDESTAMLDPQGRREVLETVEQLNKKNGMGVILITHYMEEAARADRIVVMQDGLPVLSGTPREIFSQAEQLKKIKLDVPQPTEFCEKLRQNGVDLPLGVLDVDECVKQISKILEGVKA